MPTPIDPKLQEMIDAGQAVKLDYDGDELIMELEVENDQLRSQNRRLRAALRKALSELNECRALIDALPKQATNGNGKEKRAQA